MAEGQPISTIGSVKNACDGLNNGSFTVTIDLPGTTGPYSIFVFGLSFGQIVSVANIPNAGVPISIPNLRADNYLVNVGDSDGATSNYSTFQNISAVASISATIDSGSPKDNNSCNAPNGFIHISVSGGSGSFTYAWTSTSGFTASSQDINSLSGGNYSVLITDDNTNCTRTLGPITITDPSPTTFNVGTTTSAICLGSGGTVTLSNSEGGSLNYEIYKDGVGTGIILSGTNGPLSFTIPAAQLTPAGSYNFTIRAVNGSCTLCL